MKVGSWWWSSGQRSCPLLRRCTSFDPVGIGGQEALLGVGPSDLGRSPRPDVPADLAEDGQAAAEAGLADAQDGTPPAFEGRVDLVQHRVARLVVPACPAVVFERDSRSYAAVPGTSGYLS